GQRRAAALVAELPGEAHRLVAKLRDALVGLRERYLQAAVLVGVELADQDRQTEHCAEREHHRGGGKMLQALAETRIEEVDLLAHGVSRSAAPKWWNRRHCV